MALTRQQAKIFKEFVKSCDKNSGYVTNALKYLKLNVGKPIHINMLNSIPGKGGKMITHSERRLFEIRDDMGYNLTNFNQPDAKKYNLVMGQWLLISTEPTKTKKRTPSKKVVIDTFERDDYTCRTCGSRVNEIHPHTKKPTRLHWGHVMNHKENGSTKPLKVDDGITQCSVCNEGASNRINFTKVNSSDSTHKILTAWTIKHIRRVKERRIGIPF